LKTAPSDPEAAFEAHFRLTAIHPFADGNGRAARLLMNLMLIRAGYPPVAVRPEDRKLYLDALEQASLAGDLGPFRRLMQERLDATLSEYVSALSEVLPDRS
jgi:Fic family protein